MLVPALGAVQDLVARTGSGLMYEAGNARDFACKALELANTPELLEECSACALSAFERDFSAPIVYRRYAELIEAIQEG